MPQRLTGLLLPPHYHATNDTRGRRTLLLQLASPEGTFTWRDILPGTAALTYLWLRDAETHVQPPGAHLLLGLEAEGAIENFHTAEGEDYVTANADTLVWLHAQEHTTHPTMVPGLHPWHVIIVHLPTGTNTEKAQQRWTDRWAHLSTTLQEGLQKPSLSSHTLQPAPTTAESDMGTAPPTWFWTYTRTLRRRAAEALKTTISSHQGLVGTLNDHTQKGYPLWWQHPTPEGGVQPPAAQPGLGPDLTAIGHAVATIAQQVGAPTRWAPLVITETAAHHKQAFAHFRGRSIYPALPDLDLPTHDAWAVHILLPQDTAPKAGTGQRASRNNPPAPHSTMMYQHQTSSSATTRVATTTTSTPRMSALPSPYTLSPLTLASSNRGTTNDRDGIICCTSA